VGLNLSREEGETIPFPRTPSREATRMGSSRNWRVRFERCTGSMSSSWTRKTLRLKRLRVRTRVLFLTKRAVKGVKSLQT
jgi:hypothetical protein